MRYKPKETTPRRKRKTKQQVDSLEDLKDNNLMDEEKTDTPAEPAVAPAEATPETPATETPTEGTVA